MKPLQKRIFKAESRKLSMNLHPKARLNRLRRLRLGFNIGHPKKDKKKI